MCAQDFNVINLLSRESSVKWEECTKLGSLRRRNTEWIQKLKRTHTN